MVESEGHMSAIFVQNDRVVLRRLGPEDAAAFTAYRGDPEVARFQGWDAMDAEEAKGFLAHLSEVPVLQAGKWSQLGLALPATNRLIGDIGVHMSEDRRDAELGITLAAGAQGKSLGLAAVTLVCDWLFDQVPIERIAAITHAENVWALALLARTPFVHTHDTNDVMDGVPVPERWFELRRI
jgi:ribosomal-protein-alanine N-acetyltransferase